MWRFWWLISGLLVAQGGQELFTATSALEDSSVVPKSHFWSLALICQPPNLNTITDIHLAHDRVSYCYFARKS